MKVELYPADFGESDEILRLCREASTVEGSDWDDSYPDAAIIGEDISNRRLYKILIDGDFGGIIAIGKCGFIGSLPMEYAEVKTGEIARFGLKSRYLGTGAASAALRRACLKLKDTGCEKLRIIVFENFMRGRRFYEKNGLEYKKSIYAYNLPFCIYEKAISDEGVL